MKNLIALAASAVVCGIVTTARADANDVAEYLLEVRNAIASSRFDEAQTKLALAEASMDGIADAQRASLEAEFAQLKAVISESTDGQARQTVLRKINHAMNEAQGAIGNTVTWNSASENIQSLLDDPDTTRLLGGHAVAGYQEKLGMFQRVHFEKTLKANLERASASVDRLETRWQDARAEFPDGLAERRESAIDEMIDTLKEVNIQLADLPVNDSQANALR